MHKTEERVRPYNSHQQNVRPDPIVRDPNSSEYSAHPILRSAIKLECPASRWNMRGLRWASYLDKDNSALATFATTGCYCYLSNHYR
jgi:hypothetical protein